MIAGLAERVRALAPSRTIAMNQLARKMKAEGIDVIDLTVGEPDFPTPEIVREAAKKAIDDGFTKYTAVAGYEDLREAICRKFQRENGLIYKTDEVLASNGAKHSLSNAIFSIVDKGDEVIIPAPYWVSYVEQVRLAGGTPVIISTDASTGYKLTAEQLAANITSNTKLLMLCSPSNPSGAVYSKKELEALADVLSMHERIWVLSDEIYEHINFVGEHASPALIPELRHRCIVINGVSKAYAMTGWRLGYMAGPYHFIKAATDLQGQMTTNASTISQRAALAALDADFQIVADMVSAFKKRREIALAGINGVRGINCLAPAGAFYLFPDVSALPLWKKAKDGVRSDAVADYLLRTARVATVPGSAFGDDRSIRISFASADSNIIEACKRIKQALG